MGVGWGAVRPDTHGQGLAEEITRCRSSSRSEPPTPLMACGRGGDQVVGIGVSRRLTPPEAPQALRNPSGPLRVPYP